MNINCLICTDIFNVNTKSDIYATPCGHIFHHQCLLQWMENSKTCPQCRTKVTVKALIRLYVNVANSQGIEENATVLQYKLDALDNQLKLKNTALTKLTEKYEVLEGQNKALRMKVKELEMTEMKHESVMAALKDQIKFFKQKSQSCDQLISEVSRLKGEIKKLENVQVALSGSRQQVEDIIRNENNVESLALLAATLKKSLVDTDRKKKELQHNLKKAENELSLYKRNIAKITCEYEDTKRQLESLRANYQNEVTFLKNKFTQLQSKAVLNESANNSIKRITLESPVNFNRTPVLPTSKPTVNLSESPVTSQSVPDTQKNNVSLSEDLIDLTDSPLPASSFGVLAIQRAKMLKAKPDENKFSIFKNKPPPQIEALSLPATNFKTCNMSYDGLGGSSKDDIFPSNTMKRLKPAKISSSKFRKLSATAGKTSRKMSDFLVNSSLT